MPKIKVRGKLRVKMVTPKFDPVLDGVKLVHKIKGKSRKASKKRLIKS
jgi:hypothetical protein